MRKNLVILFLSICFFFSSLVTIAQCPIQAYDGTGTPSNNPVWVSCSGAAYNFNFVSPNPLTDYSIDWGDGTAITSGAFLAANTIIPHPYAAATDTFIVTVTTLTPACVLTGLVVMEKPVNASIQIPIGGVTTSCAPANLQFTNASTDVSATTTFTWDFGDGSPALVFDETNAGQTITHTYQRGTVNCQTVVTLTAENYCSFGSPTSAQFNPIQIYDIDEADITSDQFIKCWSDNEFTFTNSTIRNCVPQGNVDQRYEYWNFGNYWGQGQDSIIDWTAWPPTFPHTISYPSVGNYDVMLVDSNRCGLDTVIITVSVVNPPVASVGTTTPSACENSTITFTNGSTTGYSYQWNFGDAPGFITTGFGPRTHTYNTAGIYTVTVIAYILGSAASCSDTATIVVSILPKPTSAFTFVPSGQCDNITVNFTDASSSATAWNWNFGNGQTSNSPTPPVQTFTVGTYNTSLLVTAANGCSRTSSQTIQVYKSPDAIYSVTNACVNSTLSFIDGSTALASDPITNWNWDFADASNSTTQNPTHNYAISDTYNVKLIVSTAHCNDSVTNPISINPLPTADFSFTPTTGCAPIASVFTNASVGAATYDWNFGDGITSTSISASITHVFNNNINDSTFYLSLIATTALGCKDTMQDSITIFGKPQVSFTNSTFSGCAPIPINFTNNTLGAISYAWNFGSGQGTSTLPNPTHTFINTTSFVQTYSVTLIATNVRGCEDTLVVPITINPEPLFGFSMIPDTGCSALSVNFPSVAGAVLYEWDFGDTQTSVGSSPTHLYTNSGLIPQSYTVELIATNAFNCKDTSQGVVVVYPTPSADFSLSQTSGCPQIDVNFVNLSAGATSYTWNFDDGSPTTTSIDVSHTFDNTSTSITETYSVKLLSENTFGCKDSVIKTVTVHPRTISSFTQTVPNCPAANVIFNNTSQGATSNSWDFGDLQTSIGINPTHLFANNNTSVLTYTVQLITNNANNCRDTSTQTITVNPKPAVSFVSDISSGCPQLPVAFTNNSIGGSTYTWNFGDGSATTTSSDPSHTFDNTSTSANAIYPVKLVVENTFGCKDSLSQNITVFPRTISDFNQVVPNCPIANISFNNLSQGASIYAWDFGDTQISAGINPSHIFANNNTSALTYIITLITNNTSNCRDTSSQTITINPKPLASFTPSISSGCAQLDVNFTNNSVGGLNYTWNFGDGSSTTPTSDPSHTFENLSTSANAVNSVKLVVENSFGCKDSITQSITVFPRTTANFTATIPNCAPFNIQFNNNSLGANTYAWDFGDTQTSAAINPSHTYTYSATNQLTHTVELITSNSNSCTDTFTQVIVINPKPIANFTVSQSIGCPAFNAVFTNTSSGNTINTWNFGDGSPSSNASAPSHIFDNTSTSQSVIDNVKLVVENSFGCKDSVTTPVTVYPMIVASFNADTPICSPVNVQFYNFCQGAATYNWDLGDFTFSGQATPSHVYVNNGPGTLHATVVLTATSADGCTDEFSHTYAIFPTPQVNFTASPQIQYYPSTSITLNNTTPNASSYSSNWTYGDGQGTTTTFPTGHVYSTWGDYPIKLVMNSTYCSDSLIDTIHIIAPVPIANFTGTNEGCRALTVNFESLAQYENLHIWSFGDGNTSNLENPTHTYFTPGVYDVKLIVLGDGGSDTIIGIDSVTVYDLPQAAFIANPTTVNATTDQVFITNISQSPDASALSYLYDFGDGTELVTESSPNHVYNEAGEFEITLYLTNSHGCRDTFQFNPLIKVEEKSSFEVPNAFTPNPNGPNETGIYDPFATNNDIFHPVVRGVKSYELSIYSRWGELLFESKDTKIGWDGYYKGKLCTQDVYIWKIKATTVDEKNLNKAGDLLLLKP